jgi:membrane protein
VTRGLSIGFVFLATAVFLVLGVVIIAGPLILYFASKNLSLHIPIGVDTLRYTIAAIVLSAFLLLLHRTLPARRLKTRELWPGVIVTGAILLAAASLFSVYLRFAPNYTVTYGALAGVILTLLFFYVAGAAIIFGAEVNATLSDERADRRAKRASLPSIMDASGEGD